MKQVALAIAGFLALAQGADEPFGLPAYPDPVSPYAAQWQSVELAWASDREIIATCRRDYGNCQPAAVRFLTLVDSAAAHQGRSRLAALNRAVNLTVAFKMDPLNYGVAELWASPLATLERGAGDCTGYAILKYHALGELGVAQEDRRIVVVEAHQSGGFHMVLAVREAGEWLILDNRTTALVTDREATGYRPFAVIDASGIRRYQSQLQQIACAR